MIDNVPNILILIIWATIITSLLPQGLEKKIVFDIDCQEESASVTLIFPGIYNGSVSTEDCFFKFEEASAFSFALPFEACGKQFENEAIYNLNVTFWEQLNGKKGNDDLKVHLSSRTFKCPIRKSSTLHTTTPKQIPITSFSKLIHFDDSQIHRNQNRERPIKSIYVNLNANNIQDKEIYATNTRNILPSLLRTPKVNHANLNEKNSEIYGSKIALNALNPSNKKSSKGGGTGEEDISIFGNNSTLIYQCLEYGMKIHISFYKPFTGNIYAEKSPGFKIPNNCYYTFERQISTEFTIPVDRCGTLKFGDYITNTIIIEYANEFRGIPGYARHHIKCRLPSRQPIKITDFPVVAKNLDLNDPSLAQKKDPHFVPAKLELNCFPNLMKVSFVSNAFPHPMGSVVTINGYNKFLAENKFPSKIYTKNKKEGGVDIEFTCDFTSKIFTNYFNNVTKLEIPLKDCTVEQPNQVFRTTLYAEYKNQIQLKHNLICKYTTTYLGRQEVTFPIVKRQPEETTSSSRKPESHPQLSLPKVFIPISSLPKVPILLKGGGGSGSKKYGKIFEVRTREIKTTRASNEVYLPTTEPTKKLTLNATATNDLGYEKITQNPNPITLREVKAFTTQPPYSVERPINLVDKNSLIPSSQSPVFNSFSRHDLTLSSNPSSGSSKEILNDPLLPDNYKINTNKIISLSKDYALETNYVPFPKPNTISSTNLQNGSASQEVGFSSSGVIGIPGDNVNNEKLLLPIALGGTKIETNNNLPQLTNMQHTQIVNDSTDDKGANKESQLVSRTQFVTPLSVGIEAGIPSDMKAPTVSNRCSLDLELMTIEIDFPQTFTGKVKSKDNFCSWSGNYTRKMEFGIRFGLCGMQKKFQTKQVFEFEIEFYSLDLPVVIGRTLHETKCDLQPFDKKILSRRRRQLHRGGIPLRKSPVFHYNGDIKCLKDKMTIDLAFNKFDIPIESVHIGGRDSGCQYKTINDLRRNNTIVIPFHKCGTIINHFPNGTSYTNTLYIILNTLSILTQQITCWQAASKPKSITHQINAEVSHRCEPDHIKVWLNFNESFYGRIRIGPPSLENSVRQYLHYDVADNVNVKHDTGSSQFLNYIDYPQITNAVECNHFDSYDKFTQIRGANFTVALHECGIVRSGSKYTLTILLESYRAHVSSQVIKISCSYSGLINFTIRENDFN